MDQLQQYSSPHSPFRKSKSVPRIRVKTQQEEQRPNPFDSPLERIKAQVREETKRKIMTIRRKKRQSETSRMRMRTMREFNEECKEYMRGANTFEEFRKKFSLKNEFYRPCVKYPEEELMDPKAILIAKAQKIENQRNKISHLKKRFSSMAQVIGTSEQKFVIPQPLQLAVINGAREGVEKYYTRNESTPDLSRANLLAARRKGNRTTVTSSPERRQKGRRKTYRIEKLIENCRNLEAESEFYEGKVEQKKTQIEKIFEKAEEKSRVFSASNDVTSVMRKMKSHDCFWELRRKKLERMVSKDAFREDFMRIIEKEECSKYKENRDRYGVMVYKMIKEKTKKENIKNTITNNAFRSYADKFLQSKPIVS